VRKVRGLNLEIARKKILKDVEEIKKSAAFVMELSRDDRIVFINENHNPGLNAIAVIGPIKGFSGVVDKAVVSASQQVEKALLTEIGIGATYPYRRAIRLKRKEGEPHEIFRRGKWFDLSPEQYQSVAPVIFRIIELLAYKKVINWEWGQYSDKKFVYSFLRKYFVKRRKMQDRWARPRIAERGVRFSVSVKDRYSLSDVYWAELVLNHDMKDRVNRLVNSIDLRLNTDSHEYKGRKDFCKLKRAKDVRDSLSDSRLEKHLLIEVVRLLRQRRQFFWMDIADMIGWDGSEPEEKKLVKTVLLDPNSRLSDIRLKITTGLDAGKDHIVFEVFPRDFRKEK